MPAKDSGMNVIQTLEAIRGQELDPEELSEIDLWNKGRALAQIVGMPGWRVILEMLASYAADSARRLHATDPKDTEDILAEHAITYTTTRICNLLVDDVQKAVDSARKTPNVVKDGLRKVSPAPPESML